MNYEVTLSDEARSSIEDQVQWYEADEGHGGADLADKWLSKLELAVVHLGAINRKHGFAPENGRWHPEIEVRQMLFRPWKTGVGWRVLYAIDESVKRVTVLQVRHEHRRWLFESEDEDIEPGNEDSQAK